MLKQSKTKKVGQLHIDVDNVLKVEAENIFKEMGLSVSEAVRIFLRQVILMREIPFDVRFTTNIPNKETMAAISEIDSGNAQELSREDLKKLWDKE